MHFSPLPRALALGVLPLLLVACHSDVAKVPSATSHAVTFSGTHVTVSSASPQSVVDGKTLALTVTPDAGYSLASAVGGTCPAGTWAGSVYTTGAIHADCTLAFTAAQTLYTLTAASDANGTIAPTGTFTVASGASQLFTATPNASFSVATWSVDGGVVQTGGTTYTLASITANHTVQVTFGASGLTPSVSTLALALNCLPGSACPLSQNAALTGVARQLTVQNTGSLDATNVAVSSAGLPAGTTVSSSTCTGTLSAGASCGVTVTPGSAATSDCTTGAAPTAGTVTLTADGGLSVQVSVYVLSYGCPYQGGFVFALDDTTPASGSVGGKVVSATDLASPSVTAGPQATSLIWSSDGAGSGALDLSRDIVPLVSEATSASDTYAMAQAGFNGAYANTSVFPFPAAVAFATCTGNSDGACNTRNILSLYNTYITNYGVGGSPYSVSAGPTPFADYAAGVCTQTISGYSDWYLPAICELNADSLRGCDASGQSVTANLAFLVGDPGSATPSTSCTPASGDCLAGTYWSSTEYSGAPRDDAIGATFSTGGSGTAIQEKSALLGARCVRVLTP